MAGLRKRQPTPLLTPYYKPFLQKIKPNKDKKMPKYTTTPKCRNQTQKESDERRGVKSIGFKVPIEFVDKLDALATKTGLTKNTIIMQAVELWANKEKADK